VLELMLDDLGKVVAGWNVTIPPHVPPVGRECVGQLPGFRLVVSCVADEDIRHRAPVGIIEVANSLLSVSAPKRWFDSAGTSLPTATLTSLIVAEAGRLPTHRPSAPRSRSATFAQLN
jgi:hypothetical protein